MKLAAPIDQDNRVNALLDAYGNGQTFTIQDAKVLLGMAYSTTHKLLVTVKAALEHCPEGYQLVKKPGPISKGGGHRFILGE